MTTTKLYSETLGHGNDIVLLHGWGMHSGIWQNIATTLAQNYRVTLIDLPGFGHSNINLSNYDLSKIAELLLAASPENAVWLGWSMGGLIATWIAIHHPQRVKQLINVASTPKFIKEENWPGMSSSVLEQFSQQLVDNYENTLVRFLALQLHHQSASREHARNLKNILFSRNKPSINTLLNGLFILNNTDLRGQLSHIQCPALQIFGRLDALVPVSAANVIQSLLPQSQTVIIDGASHVPFISHSEQFLLSINNFLHEYR